MSCLTRPNEQPFTIRPATLLDIDVLEILEEKSWAPASRHPRHRLEADACSSPPRTFVLESGHDRNVIAAIYCQFIEAVDSIEDAPHAYDCGHISSSTGKILQLLRVNTHLGSTLASSNALAGGALLRDFALEFAAELKLKTVCAVTRTTQFEGEGESSFLEYVASREATGQLSDAGLSFHLRRGATVIRCVKNWRPEDAQNLGFGVLVHYDLDCLKVVIS